MRGDVGWGIVVNYVISDEKRGFVHLEKTGEGA